MRELAPIPPILGNEAQLGQVLLNLLVNAAQAIPDGHVDEHTIRVITRDEPESGQVVIQIVDDGSGIPADILPRIFDPFFTTKEIGVGTGLGLSICMGLVTGMGGELSATSAVGHGSTFTLRLPATTWAEQPNPQTPAAAPARAARHGQV